MGNCLVWILITIIRKYLSTQKREKNQSKPTPPPHTHDARTHAHHQTTMKVNKTKEEQGNHRIERTQMGNMGRVSLYFTIITLNVNKPSSPIKIYMEILTTWRLIGGERCLAAGKENRNCCIWIAHNRLSIKTVNKRQGHYIITKDQFD